jgi:hypothetical protein
MKGFQSYVTVESNPFHVVGNYLSILNERKSVCDLIRIKLGLATFGYLGLRSLRLAHFQFSALCCDLRFGGKSPSQGSRANRGHA